MAAVAAAILVLFVLYPSQSNDHACLQLYEEAPVRGPGRWHAFIEERNYLYAASYCEIARHGAPPLARTAINWPGLVVYFSLIVAAWFAAAALVRRVTLRRALTVIAIAVVISAAVTTAWFAGLADPINL